MIWKEVKKYVKNPTLIKQAVEQNHRQDKNKLTTLKRELIKIANRIERLELEDEKFLRLYRKDIISEEKLRSQMQDTKTENQILNQRKRETELKIENEKYVNARLDALQEMIKKIQRKIDNLTFEGKRKIVELLINRVLIHESGQITLEIVIPPFSSNIFPELPR